MSLPTAFRLKTANGYGTPLRPVITNGEIPRANNQGLVL
ncbi:hypothetical protein NOR51B_837 [Luminiphilus syltensis NOR5-1B]|uniref:Uncharacterized protein n=1 Tax=Luminiphilus syltensis NOR5-1B TaxID=565045 RepID=B8KRP9_9GAMM|nr:hypothetical protein NOR51B_837 [Luminiphilus syltensis NOR5-1B]